MKRTTKKKILNACQNTLVLLCASAVGLIIFININFINW